MRLGFCILRLDSCRTSNSPTCAESHANEKNLLFLWPVSFPCEFWLLNSGLVFTSDQRKRAKSLLNIALIVMVYSKKKKKNIYYKKSKLNVHPTVLLRYLLHKGYSINIKSQTKEIFTNERTNENNLPFPTPHKKGTEQNERKLLDSQVSFDLKLLRSFFSNVRTTLYNIITSITGKYCSVAFFGIVTPKDFLHRLKS